MSQRPAAPLLCLMLASCGLTLEGLEVDGGVSGSGGSDANVVNDALPSETGSDPDSAGSDAAEDAPLTDAPAFDSGVDAPPSFLAGEALQFGGGSYVAIGALPIPTDFTLEAWIHPGTVSGEEYVLAEDRSGQGAGQFRFGLTPAGLLFFVMTDSGGSTHGLYASGYALQSPTAIALNGWSHVAVTKSGAAFVLLVNGASVDTFTASASFAYGGPAVVFRIAARVASDGTSVSGAFNGTIDEVRVWNIARSVADIAADWKHSITAAHPQYGNLLCAWSFSEGTGLSTADQKSGYPGTLVSAPAWVVSTAF